MTTSPTENDELHDALLDDDFLSGVTCNPNAPEDCESCQ